MNSSSAHRPLIQHPSMRRISQVFVEIPPSPISRKLVQSSPHVPIRSTNLKENARSQSSNFVPHVDTTPTTPSSLKRKSSIAEVVLTSVKKQKVMTAIALNSRDKTQSMPNPIKMVTATSNTGDARDELNKNTFSCHHCNRRRDCAIGIQCTSVETLFKGKLISGRRCPLKYCETCLKNKYGEDIKTIKTSRRSPSKSKLHAEGELYIFLCPKCRDACICYKCRKTRSQRLLSNSVAVPGQANEGVSDNLITKKGTSPTGTLQSAQDETAGSSSKGKSKKSNLNLKPKLKPLPKPKWTSVHTTLSLSQAQDRFQMREFALRFSSLMENISRTHLEELGEIAGNGRGVTYDDDDAEDGWVSETCVKAVVLGLLGLIANGQNEDSAKAIKAAAKEIRGNGANLNKMWNTLAVLRDTLEKSSEDPPPLTFPNPLPPSASAGFSNTRTTRSGTSVTSGYVSTSSQMIPVLAALIDIAMQTNPVREDIETAAKDVREWVKEVRDECKAENERWDAEKKTLEEAGSQDQQVKARRAAHKDIIQDLENALKVVMYTYSPRFGSLGRDHEGRTYWSLSPGGVERDNALQSIISGKENVLMARRAKKGKKKGRSTEDRKSMRDWSWFVGVWGKRPPLVETANAEKKGDEDSDDSDDDEDEDEERWWGFWEPDQIKNLAEWVGHQAGLYEDEDGVLGSTPPSSETHDGVGGDSNELGPPTRKEMKGLVETLEEYADLLEWRIKREEVR